MAISKKRDERPSDSGESATAKPKISAGRKIVLLLLLVATIVVVGLDYLPEGDSESDVVGPPARKRRPPAQSPAQPQQQQQQPAAPQPSQPAPVPTPTPPQYEKPAETLLVSSSPSDAPAVATPAVMSPGAASIPEPTPPTEAATLESAPEPTPPAEAATAEPTPTETAVAAVSASPDPVPASPPAEPSVEPMMADAPAPSTPEPAPAPATPSEAAVAEAPPATPETPAATEPAAEPAPDEAVAEATPTPEPSPEPSPEPASPAPIASAPSPELMASRSPTLPVHNDSEIVIVVGPSAAASQSVARPLPDVAIPAKVNRYVRRLFSRYDTNGDGVIDATERRQMQGDPAAIDYSANGEITLEELAAYTADFGRHRRMRLTGSMVEEAVADLPPLYVPTAEREARAAALAAAQQAAQQGQAVPVALVNETAEVDMGPADDSEAEKEGGKPAPPQPTAKQGSSKRFVTPKSRTAGLPEWFSGRDANGDGQLTVAEYTPSSEESRLTEFNRYDRNKDGVLTPQECPK